ncbi:MAG TPA: SURF1 family protein [Kouleothrix sp.]|uniref:SURF1 family protein n=1 Tax=Kouleothrix sp. TaxID=2779161 RepID=UPI002BE39766|nr:SURF1 family protein [Kouleothrix sp.]HRC74742.1 SURF1 family protein [Kouleothrix sp.]
MFEALFRGRRLWATLAVVAGALILARLGIWQLDRLAQRRAVNAAIGARRAEPAAQLNTALAQDATQEYRRVELRGVFDSAQEIVQRNRTLDGAPGVHVLTPLRFTDAQGHQLAVLVDRGWLPQSMAGPAERAAYAAPGGQVALLGQIRRSQEDFGGPSDPPLSAERPRLDAWFHVDPQRVAQQTGYPLLPVFIEQLPAAGDPALPKRDPLTDLGEGPHLGYAIQWFAFAVILLVGYLALSYQRLRRRDAERRPAEAKL